MLKLGLNVLKWLLVLAVFVGGFSWFIFSVGESGWIAASKMWSQLAIVAKTAKYVIAAIVVIYWREICACAGGAFKNVTLWEKVADNGRVFLVMFVVIEVVGFLT